MPGRSRRAGAAMPRQMPEGGPTRPTAAKSSHFSPRTFSTTAITCRARRNDVARRLQERAERWSGWGSGDWFGHGQSHGAQMSPLGAAARVSEGPGVTDASAGQRIEIWRHCLFVPGTAKMPPGILTSDPENVGPAGGGQRSGPGREARQRLLSPDHFQSLKDRPAKHRRRCHRLLLQRRDCRAGSRSQCPQCSSAGDLELPRPDALGQNGNDFVHITFTLPRFRQSNCSSLADIGVLIRQQLMKNHYRFLGKVGLVSQCSGGVRPAGGIVRSKRRMDAGQAFGRRFRNPEGYGSRCLLVGGPAPAHCSIHLLLKMRYCVRRHSDLQQGNNGARTDPLIRMVNGFRQRRNGRLGRRSNVTQRLNNTPVITRILNGLTQQLAQDGHGGRGLHPELPQPECCKTPDSMFRRRRRRQIPTHRTREPLPNHPISAPGSRGTLNGSNQTRDNLRTRSLQRMAGIEKSLVRLLRQSLEPPR
jgi:hypothetical protein